jgi:putative ABC transport system permease protein
VRVADDYVREAIAPTRFALVLLGAFSMIAIGLAAIGLYGAISYSVTLRTREIGIRVALGASPSSVTGLVVGDGLRLAVVGLVLGALVSLAATRVMASLLDSARPADALTFGGVIGLVSAVALLAAYLPARRAASIDPIEAVRAEG